MSWYDEFKKNEMFYDFAGGCVLCLTALISLWGLYCFIMVDHDLDRELQKQKIAIQAAKARVLQRVADGSIQISDSMLRDVLCDSKPVVMRKESERKYVNGKVTT